MNFTDFLYTVLRILAKPLTLLGLREDWAFHVIIGFAIQATVQPLAGPGWALGAVLLAAIGRESYNKWGPVAQRTGWSPDDIKATLAGGLAALSGTVPMLLSLLF